MVAKINTDEAKKILSEENCVLLDVRTEEEYSLDKINPSVHLDLFDDFEKKIGNLDKEKKYLVLCRSGNRSRVATSILRDEGFEAYNVEGGILDW